MAGFRAAAVLICLLAIEASAQRPDLKSHKEGKAADKAAAGAAAADASKMAAVNKAVKLMESLQAKVMEEGEKEAASYNKFACFCKDTTSDKTAAIQKGQDDQAALISEINELATRRGELDDTIQKCTDDIATAEKEMKAAEAERKGTLAEYTANEADLKGAIFALENAIKELKSSKKPSLLQVQGVSQTVRTALSLADALGFGTAEQEKSLSAFLQQPENGNAVPMEDYKFKSGDIISTLEQLMKDFVDEKNKVDAAEVESVKQHDLLMQDKHNFVKQTTKKMEDSKKEKEKTVSMIETSNKELSTVESTLLDDQEYLKKLAKMCSDKAITWDQRSKVRADELATLTQAIGIIKGTVSEKTSSSTLRLAQKGMGVRVAEIRSRDPATMEALEAEAEAADTSSLLQETAAVRSLRGAAKPEDGRLVVQQLLQSQGLKLKSTLLTALASQIHGTDPFAKIKTLIQELIERLLQEAAAEANQKGWCDKAMADAEQKREYAAEEIQGLNAEMAQLEAKRDSLLEDLETLAKQIGELKKNRQEAEDDRKDEKAENAETLIEAQTGLDALNMCIQILDRFYKTVKKETVELNLAQQSPMEDAPDAGFDNGEAYTGGQGESGGILAMLDVMKSDFERTISETEKAEAEAEQDHLEFMTETGKSLATKEQAEKEKTSQKDDAMEKLASADESLDSETKILKTAISELMELKPTCIDTGMSYEERVARREEEIASLKKAACILDAFAEYGPEGAAGAC